MSDKKDEAEKADDLDAALQAEAQGLDPIEPAVRGGLGTTDPSFADGAQEVDSKSMKPNK